MNIKDYTDIKRSDLKEMRNAARLTLKVLEALLYQHESSANREMNIEKKERDNKPKSIIYKEEEWIQNKDELDAIDTCRSYALGNASSLLVFKVSQVFAEELGDLELI